MDTYLSFFLKYHLIKGIVSLSLHTGVSLSSTELFNLEFQAEQFRVLESDHASQRYG
jgi:hypothetical protein